MKKKILSILVMTLLIATAVLSLVELMNIGKNQVVAESNPEGSNDWQAGLTTDKNIDDIGESPIITYFTDVTNEVELTGIVGFRLSVGDFNGDLYPDIFIHLPQNDGVGQEDVLKKQLLYLNVPGDNPNDPYSRKFINYTAESGIWANRQGNDEGRHSDAAIFADVDNDDDLDIFTSVYVHSNYDLNQGTNDLLLNDGSAHFTLAPNSPFHNEPIYNTAGAVFLDYNNDGNIDLFIGNYYHSSYPSGSSLSYDRLYQGHGDGSFTDVANTAGLYAATTCIYGVAAFDWNNDGFIDLFAPSYSWSVSGSTPIHWRNNGDGTFTQVQDTTHYSDNRGYNGPRNPYYGNGMASFGTMPRDYDNDGDFDFFEVFVHGWGDGASGVHSTVVTNVNDVFSWDFDRVDGRASDDNNINHHGDHYASWFDIDNDGLSDFIMTECGYSNNCLYLFKQAQDHNFNLFTSDAGLDSVNTADLPSHNALPLDYDLDGDEDLLLGFASSVEGIQLWRNDIGTQNNWITITLEGAGKPGQSNKCAIGARVELTAGGITYTREVSAGNGHQGPQVPLSLTFGLGQATQIDSIKVCWPNSGHTVTELNNIPVNQFLLIKEELVGNWSFDEGSGNIAYDSSGNGNHGTLTNMDTSTCWVDGISDGALDFDGVDDFVDCGNSVSLNPANAITIEAWVYPHSFQTEWPYIRGIIQKSEVGLHDGYLLRFGDAGLANNRLQFMVNDEKLNGNIEHNVDSWYHIVATYDGNIMRLYSNGQLDSSTSYSGAITATNDPVIIGRDWGISGNRYFDGKIDDVRVYSRALSGDEILDHFNSVQCYMGLWHMDEGSGNIAYDSSGNGNHGTLTNMDTSTCWVDGVSDSYALDFDGIDDRITIDNDPSLDLGNKATVEAWIKPRSFHSPSGGIWNCVVSKDAGEGASGEWTWILLVGYTDSEEGCLSFQIRGEDGASGPRTNPIIPKDQWSHIAGVYDGSNINMYLNGNLVYTTPVSVGFLYNCNIPIEIGYDQDKAPSYFTFDGVVDEIRIYNRALPEDEIYSHFTSITSFPPTADAGSPYTGTVGEPIIFDGSNSYDNDENGMSIVQYEWKFFEGDYWHSTTSPNISYVYDDSGSHTVTLRVTDDEGQEDTVTTTAYLSQRYPTAVIVGPTQGQEGEYLNFDGSDSHDNDENGYCIRYYHWDFDGDGDWDSTYTMPTWVYHHGGIYTVTLQVTDDEGYTDTDTIQVIIPNHNCE